MTLSIQPLVILAQDVRPLMGRNDRFNAPLKHILDKIFSRIAPIRDQLLKVKPLQQSVGLGAVMPLSRRQNETQGIAQPIHRHMNLATEPAPTATQGLLTVFFLPLPHMDERGLSCCLS